MPKILPAFPIPFATFEFDDAEALNRELRDLFLATEARGSELANAEPYVHRNDALFESRFDLFDWPQPCVRRLRDFCLRSLYGLIAELNGYDQATLSTLHFAFESWFHVTRRGGFFGPHTHPNHAWSGVYCVRHDGDDPASTSGQLVFPYPHPGAIAYVDMSTMKLKPPYARAPLRVRLEAGQLVLFPSWLEHLVYPYEGSTERITVAFNARFRQVS